MLKYLNDINNFIFIFMGEKNFVLNIIFIHTPSTKVLFYFYFLIKNFLLKKKILRKLFSKFICILPGYSIACFNVSNKYK